MEAFSLGAILIEPFGIETEGLHKSIMPLIILIEPFGIETVS